MSQRTFSLIIFILVFVVGLLPILMMVYDTFIGVEGSVSYRELFGTSGVYKSFLNSMMLSFVVATLTTLVGTALGLLFGKTNLLFSKFLLLLFIVPLLIPPYIIALGWFDIIGSEGILSELFFGFWGTAFVLFCVYLPIPILLSLFFLRQIDPRLEDAARLLTGWRGVIKNITLPLMIPAMVLSFLLVFIFTFGEYSVANVLRYSVFPLESFIQFSAFYDFKTAMIMAMPMLVIALMVLLIEQLFLEKRIFKFKTSHKIETITLSKKEQLLALSLVSIFVLIVVILPLLSIFIGAAHWDSFSIALDKAWDPLIRSLVYAFSGATVLMIFGFLSAYIIVSKMVSYWRVFDAGIVFLFTLPATVLGIALILFWNTSYTNFIYASPLIIIFGYFGKYLALSAKISQIKLSQIPNSMIQAAQMAGANWFQTLQYILLPLSKKTLIATWFVGFIFSLRENTITMLVYPPGAEPLPVYIVTQMANGKSEIISALCTIMIAVTLVPLLVFLLGKFVKEKV